MDIADLVESLRHDLIRAAEAGGTEAQAAAERLLLALDPAVRLTLMDALSQAAAEISAAAPNVTVSVRLQGREPVFAVEGTPAHPAAEEAAFNEIGGEGGEQVARITLRIPEALKARAETLAARRGQSLNTWLVAAARSAASDHAAAFIYGRHGRAGRHIKGWAK